MTTHFLPRPPTIPPSNSPNRPSTAHSTIRTVTPSPPGSRHAGFTFYLADSSECVGPKSDSFFSPPQSFYFGDVKTPDREAAEPAPKPVVAWPPKKGIGTVPVKTKFPDLGTPGAMSEQSSPTGSYVPMHETQNRPLSTPTRLPSHQDAPGKKEEASETDEKGTDQEEEKPSSSASSSSSSSEEEDPAPVPDTPTPIPRAQKRSAFLPLQAPESPVAAKATLDSSQPTKSPDYARRRDSTRTSRATSPSTASRTTPQYSAFPIHSPQHAHNPSRKSSLVHSPHFPTHTAPSYATYGSQQRRRRQNSNPHQPPSRNVSVSGGSTTHRGPSRNVSFSDRHSSRNASVSGVHGPGPGPSRNVSVSQRSNVSAGTVNSRRSVFSTPGRDELERKKTIVELDEGPFGQVNTVADLKAERRRISSGEMVKKKAKSGKTPGPAKNVCGMGGGRCQVM